MSFVATESLFAESDGIGFEHKTDKIDAGVSSENIIFFGMKIEFEKIFNKTADKAAEVNKIVFVWRQNDKIIHVTKIIFLTDGLGNKDIQRMKVEVGEELAGEIADRDAGLRGILIGIDNFLE